MKTLKNLFVFLLAGLFVSSPQGLAKEEKSVTKGNAMALLPYDRAWPLKANEMKFFSDFTLTYLGETTAPAQPGAPTSGPFKHRTFLITDSAGKEQKLELTHGQTPPRPIPFSVNGKKFTLHTMEGPKGEKLFPSSFLIQSNR